MRPAVVLVVLLVIARPAVQGDDVTVEERLENVEQQLSVIAEQQQELLRTLVSDQRRLVLGAPCRGDSDCSDLRADTVCGRRRPQQGRCVCAEGLHEVAVGQCRPYPRLLEPCRVSYHCPGITVCKDRLCDCPEGYRKPKANDTQCQSYPGISEYCRDTAECLARTRNSECVYNRCACSRGYELFLGVCS